MVKLTMQTAFRAASSVRASALFPKQFQTAITAQATPAAISAKPSIERSRTAWKMRCDVFETVYNPDRLRLGNKVLRKELRGPAIASYYPPASPVKKKHIRAAFPLFEFMDEREDYRRQINEGRRRRGKGPPKKKDPDAKRKRR
ncbi:mitochondrial ribosomal subunit S27-domain-containing protein [Lipomyces arxii]|uniref:mitochondrial 37S ribosomal mS33 domain-containing protein n=1 Tax=Lipomyces arxii TaxID=56418 RepID=UPI0034CD7A3D